MPKYLPLATLSVLFVSLLLLLHIGSTFSIIEISRSVKSNSTAVSDTDWKTYESTLFSFKYPPDFLIDNTRNAVLTWGPITDLNRKFFGKTDNMDYIGPITSKTLHGKEVSMRDLSYDFSYLGKNGYIDKIRQVSIADVKYYLNNKWINNGTLYFDIHVDGSNPNVDSIADAILNSLKVRDIDNTQELITVKINSLEFRVPKIWWYRCLDNLCAIDIDGNTQPKRPAHFYVQYFTKNEIVYPMIEEKLLKNKQTKKMIISDISGLRMDGIIDPRKYTEGSAWYSQNSSTSVVKFETKDGTYIISAVTTNKEIKKNFDQILSTFKFLPTTTSTTKYSCPAGEWVDCMPGPGVEKPQCQPEYLKWASSNCPNYKGAAL